VRESKTESDPNDRRSEVWVKKKRQTFEKIRREQALRERRERKQERKEARLAEKLADQPAEAEGDDAAEPSETAATD